MGNDLPARKSGPDWIIVATVSGMMEAAIIAGRLKSLGIPVAVQNEPLGTVFGLTVGSLGQARVLVPEPYYDAAMTTLEPDESILWLEDGEESDEDDDDE